jgi:capsular exopolysaccharide synthesis family protein
MRKPSLGRALGLTKKVGLSNVLAGSNSAEDALAPCGAFANLSVLTVGPVPPNPADLIASESMRELLRDLRGRFDHIVIDSPPAIPFSDARVISSLVDGVILVGRYGLTTRRSITRCAQVLEEVRAPMIGVVVNGMDFASADYDYYNYGYGSRTKNNGYYGYEKN